MTHRSGPLIGGRYRLDAEIGRGGMSTVYRAFDTVLERPVAIKLMHREIATDSDQLERFRREARVGRAAQPSARRDGDRRRRGALRGRQRAGRPEVGHPLHRARVRRRRDAQARSSAARGRSRSRRRSPTRSRSRARSARRTSTRSCTATSSRRTS